MKAITKNIRTANEADVNALAENLARQIDVFKDAIDLGLKQRQVLVNHQYEENIKVNQAQEEIAQKLENLEKNRLLICEKIWNSISFTPKSTAAKIQCKDLYPYISKVHQDLIEGHRQDLLIKVKHLTSLNNINSVLINSALNLNQSKLEIMVSLVEKKQRNQTKLYGAKGNSEQLKNSEFHFLNKRV